MSARDDGLIHEQLTRRVIGAFFEVHSQLGFGFMEGVYAAAMQEVLTSCGHVVQREVGVPVYFRRKMIAYQRLDMLIDDVVILELKSTTNLHSSAKRQLLNYLKATQKEVGLLLHFGLEAKFERVVCSHPR